MHRYALDGESSPLPRRTRWTPWAQEDLIERYGLGDVEIPNTEEIDVWLEHWTDEPKQIALGWVLFAEPWDWARPRLEYEHFEIAEDHSLLFGYDDIHPEGEPDTLLRYDANFNGLCIRLEDAESIAPMLDLLPFAFEGRTNSPTRRIGRPRGSGYADADDEIVRKMVADKKLDPEASLRSLAEKYVDEAKGHGTRESKIKRLERRLSGYERD